MSVFLDDLKIPPLERKFYVMGGGQMLGELTEDEARQMVEIMRTAGAVELAKAFEAAFGFEPSYVVEYQCERDCGTHEAGEWHLLRKIPPGDKERVEQAIRNLRTKSKYRIKEV